jgi:hypothetical protein
MRRNPNRPSVAILIAALALAACQSTPAAPPTQTPVNPKDTFATPGAPTPFLPTMTPAPSPTVRPTVTAVPPTAVPATVALPTLTPTKGGTPTPTPVIVNGQPKMWWVDQMVKQADGSFMAPEAVRQTIRELAVQPYLKRLVPAGVDPLQFARAFYATRTELARDYYIGALRDTVGNSTLLEIHVDISATTAALDVRGFTQDGLSAYVTVEQLGPTVNVYRTNDWAARLTQFRGVDTIEVWKVRFDMTDFRWKYEELVLAQKK